MDRLPVGDELSLRVGLTGHSGHLRIEPLQPNAPPSDLPEFVLPPAFPRETKESIKEYLVEKYLTPRLDPDEFSPERTGRHWDFDWFGKAKVPLEPSLPRSVMVPEWELPFRRCKGQQQGRWEPQSVQVEISELTAVAEESGALPRITGPAKDFVRGSVHNRPFRPGGLDGSQSLSRVVPDGALNGEWLHGVLSGGPVEKVPPSFKQGMDLGDVKAFPSSWNVAKGEVSNMCLPDGGQSSLSLQFDDLFKRAWETDFVAKDAIDGFESQEGVVV